MKPISIEDYEDVADDFFAKYDFVQQRIHNGNAEDVIKIMDALNSTVHRTRTEDKESVMGF
tara:strand:- start:202 stop:384 length:183 start_codon:yes stop_codon:yes gene_type:complete